MTKHEQILVRKMIADAVQLTVPPTIEKVVNGKIKEVKELMETHIMQHTQDNDEARAFQDEMKPFIQAKAGGALLFKGIIGAGSFAVAWVALKSIFPSL